MSSPIHFRLESHIDATMAETSDPAPEEGIGDSASEELDRRGSHPERAWCTTTNMWTGCDVLPGNVVVVRDNKQHRKFTTKLLKTMQVGYTGHAGCRITV